MRRVIFRRLLATYLLLLASAATAFTYQPMLDEDLRDQSPLVLRGEVLSAAASGLGSTVYRVSVLRVYKGEVPINEIQVQVPGVSQAIGRHVPGMPVLEPGREVLMFLAEDGKGGYRLVHSTLGAFHAIRNALGQKVYMRDLSDTRALAGQVPARSAVNEVPRVAKAFLRSLGASEQEAEYDAAYQASSVGTTEKDAFTLLGSKSSRWWEFDNNVGVNFKAHSSGQPGMTGGGFSEFQNAIAVWVNDTGSNVLYGYTGTTTAGGGLDTPDGVNTILFNDPNDEIEGAFSCQDGGVLAVGGYVNSGQSRNFKGQSFGIITEGDIVTNNGAGCFFGRNGNADGEEVFAHELGHTLGLGHSCENEGDCSAVEDAALMRANPQADGRGAFLGADDRQGVAFMYPAPQVTPDPDPEPDPDPDTGGDSGTDPDPDTPSGGGGGGGSSGGGGCVMSAAAVNSPDPAFALLLLASALYLGSRRSQRLASYSRKGF